MIRSLVLLATLFPASAFAQVFLNIAEIETPAGDGAMEPSLFAMPNGDLVMSWTEPDRAAFNVKTATLQGSEWTAPTTVVSSESLFVNWADFPTVAAFEDGTLAVSWLQENAQLSYAYDINIGLSNDAGVDWGNAIIPHSDRSARQHGFLTLLPSGPDEMVAIWLDARDYNSQRIEDSFDNAMQLRSTTITQDGRLGEDVVLDIRTCTCCQTSATVTGDGSVLVAYRDRSENEIRDIYVVRRQGDVWSKPANVHADGWEISGCPVNGPAIHAAGNDAVVAWFTGANNVASVKMAISGDAGRTFGTAFRVDEGEGIGRVSVVMLPSGDAIVSWVKWTNNGEALMVCRATRDDGCVARQQILSHSAPGSFNFPQLVIRGDTIYLAWTEPLDDPDIISKVRLASLAGIIAGP
jgi:hypothetical protein